MKRPFKKFSPEEFEFTKSTCRNSWVKDEWWLSFNWRSRVWTITYRGDIYYKGYIKDEFFATQLFRNLKILN
jgi:hypothetical protein